MLRGCVDAQLLLPTGIEGLVVTLQQSNVSTWNCKEYDANSLFSPLEKRKKKRKQNHPQKTPRTSWRGKKPQVMFRFSKWVNGWNGCVWFSDKADGHNEDISTFSATQNREYLLYLKIWLGLPCDLSTWMLHSNCSLVIISSKMQPCVSFTYIRKVNKVNIVKFLFKKKRF